MSEIEDFKAQVEAFLVAQNLSPSRFGTEIAGDPQFVFDLRSGREPRQDTRTRIMAAMRDHAAGLGGNQPIRVGIAGLGTVGAALARMLADNRSDIKRRLGREVTVTVVSARTRDRDRGVNLSGMAWADDPVGLARDSEIDLFVELIGGEDGPAYAAVRAALERGIPVVTANKALLAKHGTELARVAEASGTTLGFEAAVAGGIPVIKTLREGLGAADVTRVYGIMNGTCNYILTRMADDGIDFAECLKDAQDLGYAEADPTFDIDGFDTAHKLAVLTTLCFETELNADAIHVEGIRDIGLVDIKVAQDLGYKIKLLGIARRTPDGIEQRVHPTLVPVGTAIAGVDGVLNAIALETNHVSDLMMAGPGAGGEATAASVLSDILDIARGQRVPPLGVPVDSLKPYVRAPMRAHAGGYYVRLNARDVAGALGAITQQMGAAGISIDSLIQRPDLVAPDVDPDVASRTIVIFTQETTESAIRTALEAIDRDGFTIGAPRFIRIERF